MATKLFLTKRFEGECVCCEYVIGSKGMYFLQYHRYTVRAKAGGAQSSNDNSGRKAQSIGSSLRRHGEAMLREDIRGILKTWATFISNSSLILLSVPKTMRPTLFEECNSPILDKLDSRIRYVPFMTDKPTFETIKDIHSKCSTVYIREVVTDTLIKEVEESGHIEKNLPDVTPKLSLIKEKEPDPEQALISCPESRELINILSAGGDEGIGSDVILSKLNITLKSIADRYGSDNGIVEDPSQLQATSVFTPPSLCRDVSLNLSVEDVINLPGSIEDLWTPLHWASDIGHPEIITRLLSIGADPTVRDVRGRTPFFLCKVKEAKDSFRRYRAIAEEKWNWVDAGVPAALTPEMERLQKEKEKEKKKKAKEKKAQRKLQEQSEMVSPGPGEDLPHVAKAIEVKPRSAQAGNCALCSVSLFRKSTVQVGENSCCSPECAAKLKRKLAADAAAARFNKDNSK